MSFQTVQEILEHYSSYYRRLNPTNRHRFQDRLANLLQHFDFIPQSLAGDVTLEMKIVIASAQIQLTFGLESYLPKKYNEIVVLPSAYRVTNYENRVAGHVDPSETRIYLSWRNVQHGFMINDDAINVALHEFAHWLEFESRHSKFESQHLCELEFSDWRREAQKKLIKIRTNQNKFLKDYGGRDLRELFAVSVEAFFERSQKFKTSLPLLYQSIVQLLNQDPTRQTNPVITSIE